MTLSSQRTARTLILEGARASRSVVVTAAPGSGLTHLLQSVEEQMRHEMRGVVLIRGHDADSAIPLAAVSELLAQHDLTGVASLSVYTRLPLAVAQARTVVIVDDIAALDRASAVLIGQLIRAGGTVIVGGRTETEIPPSLQDELRRREAVTVRLPLLPPDDALALAAELLGDELELISSAEFLALCEGTPALIVDLLHETSVSSGSTGALLTQVRPGPRARALVSERLSTCAPEHIDLVTAIAVAGRLPRDLADPSAWDALDRAGVILNPTAPEVRLARPLDGLVLTDAMSSRALQRRGQDVGRRVAEIPGWREHGDMLVARHGGTVPTDRLLAAAEHCLTTNQAEAAAELIAAAGPITAIGDDMSVRCRILRGRIASVLGDHAGALEEFEALLLTDLDAKDLRRIGQELGLLHAVRAMDPSTAVVAVTGVMERIGDTSERRVLELELVKWRMMAGQRTEPMQHDASVEARERLTMAVIGAMVASMDGAAEDVENQVAVGTATIPLVPDAESWVGALLDLSRYLGLAFDGKVTEAEQWGTAQRDHAAEHASPSLGMWEYAGAETALHRGDSQMAAALAQRAVRHLEWRDYTGLKPSAAALTAVCHARAGRVSLAESLIAKLPDEQLLDVKVDLHASRVRAERLLRNRHRDDAARTLDEVAQRAANQQHRHLAIMAADEAFMIQPSSRRSDVVAELSHGRGLGGVLAARAAAVIADELDELSPWVDTLVTLGLVGRAVQLASMLSARSASQGHDAAAQRWRHRAVVLCSDHGAQLWPGENHLQLLRPREWDVAQLAVARMRSREIAEHMQLSVRTVDNHLTQIYRKLGIGGRAELHDAVGPLKIEPLTTRHSVRGAPPVNPVTGSLNHRSSAR